MSGCVYCSFLRIFFTIAGGLIFVLAFLPDVGGKIANIVPPINAIAALFVVAAAGGFVLKYRAFLAAQSARNPRRVKK